ncbi:LOW QUALITY PROTEIN: tumor necrosis factor receptor superfamily member 14 [Onychomys torridus]|uniref:LOW QUALITY PROTEIN: tumor necrosis factor receptor superfamily member 14 n=1 Tax=Onychomys torridus TaxID=38674 RepID=UPI00167F89BC|nr:LOW QUALITY PROTEIN: tumor necrosis factor receptor superfamily member 14 [Onychomys torridus]
MEPLPGCGSSPWSQAPTANTFSLVLCVFLLNFLCCLSVQPLCREEEYSVGDECCPMCNPGYHVKRACSEFTGTVCAPCPPQTYTAHANGLSKCLSCGVCDPDVGLVTWRVCSSREDTVCRCSPGYFCETQEGDHCSTCLPHTTCPRGQRVLRRVATNRIRNNGQCRSATVMVPLPLFVALPGLDCSFSSCYGGQGTGAFPGTIAGDVWGQKQENTVKFPVTEVGLAVTEEETAFNLVNSG